jgi:N-acyl-phosphatidylethanolamine-hydrolysing phospholipase D
VKKFINPHNEHSSRGLFHFILWQFGFYNDHEPLPPIPEHFKFPNGYERVDWKKPSITWVNHSTFWVQCDGKSLLMDPIWTKRCSPVSFMGPERRINPSPLLEEITSVDIVIISHNHYDHLDKRTVFFLQERFPSLHWIVPLGVKKWFARLFSREALRLVFELNWWEQIVLQGITFTAVPAQHFSGRGFFDRNRSLWMGCVCEFPLGKRLYFAGDTGYNSIDFKKIGKKFGAMDLSLLPIGVYTPRKLMQPVHVSPTESLLIHQDVRSKLSVAGHWGTFRLSHEELERPPFDLFLALQKANIRAEEFRVLNPGQAINW